MRNRSCHGAWVLALLLALPPINDAAADPESTPAQPVDESSAEKADKGGGGKAGQEQPEEPFVPSETISADSAVSFPVDI